MENKKDLTQKINEIKIAFKSMSMSSSEREAINKMVGRKVELSELTDEDIEKILDNSSFYKCAALYLDDVLAPSANYIVKRILAGDNIHAKYTAEQEIIENTMPYIKLYLKERHGFGERKIEDCMKRTLFYDACKQNPDNVIKYSAEYLAEDLAIKYETIDIKQQKTEIIIPQITKILKEEHELSDFVITDAIKEFVLSEDSDLYLEDSIEVIVGNILVNYDFNKSEETQAQIVQKKVQEVKNGLADKFGLNEQIIENILHRTNFYITVQYTPNKILESTPEELINAVIGNYYNNELGEKESRLATEMMMQSVSEQLHEEIAKEIDEPATFVEVMEELGQQLPFEQDEFVDIDEDIEEVIDFNNEAPTSIEVSMEELMGKPSKEKKGLRGVLKDLISPKMDKKTNFKLTRKGIVKTVATIAIVALAATGISKFFGNNDDKNKDTKNNKSKKVVEAVTDDAVEVETEEVVTPSSVAVEQTLSDLGLTIEVEEEAKTKSHAKSTGEVKAEEVVVDEQGTAWLNEQEKQESANIGTTIESGHQAENGKVYTTPEEVKKEENVGKELPVENGYEASDGNVYETKEDAEIAQQPEVKEENEVQKFVANDGTIFSTKEDMDLYNNLLSQGYFQNGETEVEVEYDTPVDVETNDTADVVVESTEIPAEEEIIVEENTEIYNSTVQIKTLKQLKEELIAATSQSVNVEETGYQLVK